MRFLADIPIGRNTVEHLSRQGHDVAAAHEELSPSALDSEIVRLAAKEARIILCLDLDFAAIVALSGKPLPSVITFRLSRHRSEVINRRLDAILPEIAKELEKGALATVEDHRVRIRPLPVRPRRDLEKGS